MPAAWRERVSACRRPGLRRHASRRFSVDRRLIPQRQADAPERPLRTVCSDAATSRNGGERTAQTSGYSVSAAPGIVLLAASRSVGFGSGAAPLDPASPTRRLAAGGGRFTRERSLVRGLILRLWTIFVDYAAVWRTDGSSFRASDGLARRPRPGKRWVPRLGRPRDPAGAGALVPIRRRGSSRSRCSGCSASGRRRAG
jgi:hypothetical protein